MKNGWHEGVPTKDGLYVIAYRTFIDGEKVLYRMARVELGRFFIGGKDTLEREILGFMEVNPWQ